MPRVTKAMLEEDNKYLVNKVRFLQNELDAKIMMLKKMETITGFNALTPLAIACEKQLRLWLM